MNSFVLLSILYGLMTLGSASILYFSFKGKVDASGKYFLISETLMMLAVVQVISINMDPGYINPATLFFGNFVHLASDAAVFFSIYSLSRKILASKYFAFLLFDGVYSALIEMCRFVDPKLPVVFVGLGSAVIALATFFACKSPHNRELSENIFLKWIRYIEIGLLAFAALRVASYFSSDAIVPRQPPASVAIMFTLFLALSVFRYISYQSLRISWFDPMSSSENPLNRNLTKLVRENNQFLQGLIASNRAIGISALANSLAHQLSQPITGVLFQTESVKRDLVDLGGQQRLVGTLNTVTNQLERLSDLVNNLRRLFRQDVPDIKPVNLQEACDEILEIVEPTLKSKEIAFVKQYKFNPIVRGNAIQLQQVLINLFNNAIDAIVSSEAQTRKISLTISQEDAFALIYIEDSGNGISLEASAAMFELYQTTKKDGMGIGLWLSKEIIDRHEGRINASNSEKGGAVFEILLPLSKESAGDA